MVKLMPILSCAECKHVRYVKEGDRVASPARGPRRLTMCGYDDATWVVIPNGPEGDAHLGTEIPEFCKLEDDGN